MMLSKLTDVNEKLYQIKELWASAKDDLIKQKKPKKVMIIHDLDLDGCVGGAMAHKFYTTALGEAAVSRTGVTSGKSFETHIKNLIESEEDFSETMLVVIDHSLPVELTERLGAMFQYVNWFDHHPIDAAKAKLHDFDIDTEKFVLCITPHSCSAMCFFQTVMMCSEEGEGGIWGTTFSTSYIHNLFTVARATDIYDRWLWPEMLEEKLEGINEHIPSPKSVCMAQDAVGLNAWFYMQDDPWKSVYEMIACENLNIFFDAATVGWEFYQLQEKEAEKIAKKNTTTVTISKVRNDKTLVEWKAGVVFHSSNISNLAKKVLDTYPDISMALVVYAKANSGDLRVSVRTRDNAVETAEDFAKYHGGGGHKNAAGFHAPIGDVMSFLSESSLKSD